MLVRCGRCRTELEVTGPGEFLCPRCGTRNVVRGAAPAPSPYDLPDLTVPGGRPAPPPADGPDPSIRWIACPACAYRFATGVDAGDVVCPNCRTSLSIDESGSVSARQQA